MVESLRSWRGRRFGVDPLVYPALAGRVFSIVDAAIPRGTDALFILGADEAGGRRWFRDSELVAAPAPVEQLQEQIMSTEQQTEKQAQAFAAKAMAVASSRGLSLADAIREISLADPAGALAWRAAGVGVPVAAEPDDDAASMHPTLMLSAPIQRAAGESFIAMCSRYSREQRVDLRTAIRVVSLANPTLAQQHREAGL